MWAKGHFASQMYLFLSILMTKNCRVIVLCAEPGQITAWTAEYPPELHEKVFADHFSLEDRIGSSLLKKGQAWQHLNKCVHQAEAYTGWQVDLVCITYLDLFINKTWRTLGCRGRFDYPWTGLYFAPFFLRSKLADLVKPSRIRQWVGFHIVKHYKNCTGIGILDEGVYTKLRAHFENWNVFILPDVTDEELPACIPDKITGIRAKAGSRAIIGLVGLLQKRKGLLSFLRSMEAVDEDIGFFLLAGYLSIRDYSPEEQQEIHRLIAARQGKNGHFVLDYIEDPAEVNAYIEVCDALYLGYEGYYHSSGILTKAAVFRKPVITAKGYCMGERTEKYQLGLTVAEGDLREIKKAIRIMTDDAARKQISKDAQFDGYLDFHNRTRLETVLCAMLGVES